MSDSSTVPRYILVRENMPVRGLGVDSYTSEINLTHSHHPTRATGDESGPAEELGTSLFRDMTELTRPQSLALDDGNGLGFFPRCSHWV
jgi:hypothetical protein